MRPFLIPAHLKEPFLSPLQYNEAMERKQRIILAITGASGAIYGLRTLETLHSLGIETHLVISTMGEQVLLEETGVTAAEANRLANVTYTPTNLGAAIASGSFVTDGMIVAPCSIKTLSGIANSYAENLIQRSADVCLKEGRPLILAVRETPLHAGHLRLMTNAAQSGAIIFPPVPAFYQKPATVDELVNATVGRMLARIGVENDLYSPWGE